MLLMSVLASEERTYILQNWRADVVATTRANGEVIEKIQYTPYGSALTHLLTFTARADFNSDGGVDGADIDAFTAAWANSEPSADVDQSGGVDGGDVELFYTLWANSANQEYYETQPGACQTTSIRFGYAGYVRDASVNNGGDVSTFGERDYTGAMAGLYHVRHRAYDPELGRWTRRDPIHQLVQRISQFADGRTNSGILNTWTSREQFDESDNWLASALSTVGGDRCLIEIIDVISAHGLVSDIGENIVLQSSLLSYARYNPVVATDPTGLACTVRGTCNLTSSTPPRRGLSGQKCTSCNYSCGETSRVDTPGSGNGCNEVPQSAVWTTSVQVCVFFGTPTCTPTITDKRIWMDTAINTDRLCSRTSCRAGCASTAGAARLLCRMSPCPALCRAAATSAEAICVDVCNVWCRNP